MAFLTGSQWHPHTQITTRLMVVLWQPWARAKPGRCFCSADQAEDWQLELDCWALTSETWSMACHTCRLCTQITTWFKVVLWQSGPSLAAPAALLARHGLIIMPAWLLTKQWLGPGWLVACLTSRLCSEIATRFIVVLWQSEWSLAVLDAMLVTVCIV